MTPFFPGVVRLAVLGVGALLAAPALADGRNDFDPAHTRLGFELHGAEGMLIFDQERMNELHLYQNRGPMAEQGFKTILTGPAHPPYGAFCPAPGHQLGFNDLKVIECAGLITAIEGGALACPSFDDAVRIERVVHAVAASARAGGVRVRL